MNYPQLSINFHRQKQGKIALKPKARLKNRHDLAIAYTPGVAAVCEAISHDQKNSWTLTNRANQIAIVSDGTAILGLGNLGPEAAMPVMEGKAVIFNQFAGIDAFPLCIKASGPEEIIKFCQQIVPSFAGINLEDIAAPACFTVLERLEKELPIPVFHDDQDGTAIIVLAGLINACRVEKKNPRKLKIIINGAGAAGIATARLLLDYGVDNIIILDSEGMIYDGRNNLNPYKQRISKQTNVNKKKGGLADALTGADVFIGLSKANLVSAEMVQSMNARPIIFAMANPIPEIMPDIAYATGAAIVGTGRSDMPNQINNALVFPGIFRGLLDNKIIQVDKRIKIKAAEAIANHIKPTKNKILPSVMDASVVKTIAKAMKK